MCAEHFPPNDQVILLSIEPPAWGGGCAEVLRENLHSVVDATGGVGHQGHTFDTPAVIARLEKMNVVNLAYSGLQMFATYCKVSVWLHIRQSYACV